MVSSFHYHYWWIQKSGKQNSNLKFSYYIKLNFQHGQKISGITPFHKQQKYNSAWNDVSITVERKSYKTCVMYWKHQPPRLMTSALNYIWLAVMRSQLQPFWRNLQRQKVRMRNTKLDRPWYSQYKQSRNNFSDQ